MDKMPTEQEMRSNPGKEFIVDDDTKIWFEDVGEFQMFVAASVSTGDAGDSFETYEQLLNSF